MNDISATIALANMRFAAWGVNVHRRAAKYMYEALKDLDWLFVPPYHEDTSYWIFPLVVNNGIDRDDFEKYLNASGIQAAQVHTRNDKYSVTKEFDTRTLPGLDYFSTHQTNVPCGWWLEKSDLDLIIDTIRNYR
jgi:dTDP-4-amino-4,6-dideoxygalactose transaminase